MADTLRNNAAPLPRAWPFEEAQKVVARLRASGKGEALFETGYGPSGLPHIGTFGEVARTSWVRRAFSEMTGLPSRLLAFSDDMDGLRKVPDNVPERAMLAQHLGKPLTRIPDPFGTHESYGAHNNARLRSFLDAFGFDYEFASSTEYYKSGRFDAALLRVLETHDAIVAVMLPSLGPERRATYSPILPLHPVTGRVMQVRIEKVDLAAGSVGWRDPEDGAWYETKVTGGAAKLQWKADWAMRWHALGIDYEMSGKDLIDSVRLSGRICRILGSAPPVGFTYELFLDEHGQKISKSRGNGISVEQWLRYAPREGLEQFLFNAPQRAKRLYFDVIPRAVDEFVDNWIKLDYQLNTIDYYESECAGPRSGLRFALSTGFTSNQGRPWQIPATAEEAEQLLYAAKSTLKSNPVWHIRGGDERCREHFFHYSMLLNLASVANVDTPEILWGFIRRYDPKANPQDMPFLARLVDHAVAYYQDFVRPAKRYRSPTPQERAGLQDLAERLATYDFLGLNSGELEPLRASDIQNELFEIGKRHGFGDDLRAWFACLYQVLLGQNEGPRFGNFIAIYGVAETIALIRAALARSADAA